MTEKLTLSKKRLFVSILLMVSVLFAASYFVYGEVSQRMNRGQLLNQKIANMINDPNSGVVASLNDFEFSKDYIDHQRAIFEPMYDRSYSDSEIFLFLLEHQVLFNMAIDAGFVVTEEDIDFVLNASRDALRIMREDIAKNEVDEQSMHVYTMFTDYLKSLNMTDDEYYVYIRDFSEKQIYVNMMKHQLREEYAMENGLENQYIFDAGGEMEMFLSGYNAYVDNAVKNEMKRSNLTIYDAQLASSYELTNWVSDAGISVTHDFSGADGIR